MWAHLPAVAFDCGPFETGTGKFGHPGQVPGVVTVNFELGLSELSCASTEEHAERSASRSRCLKSQDFVFTSVLFNCVVLLVRD